MNFKDAMNRLYFARSIFVMLGLVMCSNSNQEISPQSGDEKDGDTADANNESGTATTMSQKRTQKRVTVPRTTPMMKTVMTPKMTTPKTQAMAVIQQK